MAERMICTTPLWNASLSWNTLESPLLTACFEDVVLKPGPMFFLTIFGLIDILTAMRSNLERQTSLTRTSSSGISRLHIFKILLNLVLIGLNILELVVQAGFEKHQTNSVSGLVGSGLEFFGNVAMLIIYISSYQRGVYNTGIQFLYWFLSMLTQAVLFRNMIVANSANSGGAEFYLNLIELPIVITRFALELFLDGATRTPKSQAKESPDKTSTFLSKIFFFWYDPLAILGYQRLLTLEDLWDLNPEDTTRAQYQLFQNQLKSCPVDGSVSSLLLPLVRCYGSKWFWAAVLKLFGSLIIIIQPQILSLFISHISSKSYNPSWKGYLFMGLLSGTALVQTLITNYSDKRIQMIGLRIKSVLANAIYRKTLLLSNESRNEADIGAIHNLMSVDIQKFNDLFFINNGIPAPFLVILATYFLYITIGFSTFVGLGVLGFLVVTTNTIGGWLIAIYQRQLLHLKDQRTDVTSEVFNGIKVVKYNAWEQVFQKQIEQFRKQEVSVLWKISAISSISIVIYQILPFLVTITMFAHYVLVDPSHSLTAEKVFVVVNLVNIFKGPITLLPMAISTLTQMYVSLTRLAKFFHLQELDSQSILAISNNCDNLGNTGEAIRIENGKFTWSDKSTFRFNCNLTVKMGDLIGVVGKIGAGKSSLLSAILGEMTRLKGRVSVQKSVAYVSQNSWIQNASIRDNILFGTSLSEKYAQVLHACSLEQDISVLPGGDLTEIGEKGINLSGGQKARVALARAAVKDSSIYLLDDPLSAVDAGVGRHVFDTLIGPDGLLHGKTRILVTHNPCYLPHVDRIIFLENGRIAESGSYEELILAKGKLARLIKDYANDDGCSEDNQVPTKNSSKSKKFALHDSHQTDKMIAAEKLAEGATKFRFYINYFRSAGVSTLLISVLSYLSCIAFLIYGNFYLANWSTLETEISIQGIVIDNFTQHQNSTHEHLIFYALLGSIQSISYVCAFASLTLLGVIATKKLHNQALRFVLQAPMSYFETTLMGVLLNRFARDVEVVDFTLPLTMRIFSVMFINTLVTFVVISIPTPLFVLVLIPMILGYIVLQRFYVVTSRQLRRLESVSRSPIYSHFNETLSGIATIRAFQMSSTFATEAEHRIDANQKCAFAFLISKLWMTLRLEIIGSLVIFFTCLFILTENEMDAGTTGLSVTFALNSVVLLNFLAVHMAELENHVVSVERLGELTEVPQEKSREIPESKPSAEWPKNGQICFNDYSTQYRTNLELVLSNFGVRIEGGEKVGVVGRTGAGKSSLAAALWRLMEASNGSISIDGIDISTIGLYQLRKRITLIPQEPLLFNGSLRKNVDPLGEHSDDKIWRCLELAHLKSLIVNKSQDGLDLKIETDGTNFSVGERQLICLARALLRQSRILVLDEATASLDMETDELIQSTIRQEFANATVITIAHRLNTILDSDKILVLKDGRVLEYDSPVKLLADTSTAFYEMAKKANII